MSILLLPFVILHRRVDLLLHRVEVKCGWFLHRRVLDRRHGKFCHLLLDQNEAPELARHEVIDITKSSIVEALVVKRRWSLKRILSEVDHGGHVGGDFRTWPALRLLEEREFEVINSDGPEVRPTEVEEFVALGRPVPSDEVHLVVAIKVVRVGPVAELDTLEQLVGDVGVAGGGHEGREPVEAREDSILDRARLDVARPARDALASTGSEVVMWYLALRNGMSCMLGTLDISGKVGSGPSFTTLCLPTLPHRGSTVASSVSVAQQCTRLRGP